MPWHFKLYFKYKLFITFWLNNSLDIGNKSRVVVGSVHDFLQSAVRELHEIFAGHFLAVRTFAVTEIIAGVIVLDGVGEIVWHGLGRRVANLSKLSLLKKTKMQLNHRRLI